jgi:hypothetical protein
LYDLLTRTEVRFTSEFCGCSLLLALDGYQAEPVLARKILMDIRLVLGVRSSCSIYNFSGAHYNVTGPCESPDFTGGPRRFRVLPALFAELEGLRQKHLEALANALLVGWTQEEIAANDSRSQRIETLRLALRDEGIISFSKQKSD